MTSGISNKIDARDIDVPTKTIRQVLEMINPCMCSFTDGFSYDKTQPCHCRAGELNIIAIQKIKGILDSAKPDRREEPKKDYGYYAGGNGPGMNSYGVTSLAHNSSIDQ